MAVMFAEIKHGRILYVCPLMLTNTFYAVILDKM